MQCHHVNCIVSLSKMKPPTTILLHVDWNVAVLMLAVDNGASLGLFFNWKVEVHPFNRFISCTLANFLGVRKTEAYCLRLLTFFIQQTSILYHLECPLHLLHTFQLLSCLNTSLALVDRYDRMFFLLEKCCLFFPEMFLCFSFATVFLVRAHWLNLSLVCNSCSRCVHSGVFFTQLIVD